MLRDADRRKFGRRTVCKPAWISQDLRLAQRCVVIDISEGGARLKIDQPDTLCPEFMLAIPEDDLLYKCRIAHRQKDSVGVEFMRCAQSLSYAVAKANRS